MSDSEEYNNFHEIFEDYYISSEKVKEIERVSIGSKHNIDQEKFYFIEMYYLAKAGQEHPDGLCITDPCRDHSSVKLQLQVFLTKLDKIRNKINKLSQ